MTDAPCSFIDWFCKQTAVYAYKMLGQKFDLWFIEGFESIRMDFLVITR